MGNLSKGILAAMRADIKTFWLAELKLKTLLLNWLIYRAVYKICELKFTPKFKATIFVFNLHLIN